MGGIEELPEDSGACPTCGKIATIKCTACKNVYYCNKNCQKKDWKTHRPLCKMLPYKVTSTIFLCLFFLTLYHQIARSSELGNHIVANRNIKAGEIILTEAPLVLGPAQTTIPVCLGCYVPVDGSYKCPR